MKMKFGEGFSVSYDEKIGVKIQEEINKFKEKYNIFPNKLFLSQEDYLSLYIQTLLSWTRLDISMPHVLTTYSSCDIIILSPYEEQKIKVGYKTKKKENDTNEPR